MCTASTHAGKASELRGLLQPKFLSKKDREEMALQRLKDEAEAKKRRWMDLRPLDVCTLNPKLCHAEG